MRAILLSALAALTLCCAVAYAADPPEEPAPPETLYKALPGPAKLALVLSATASDSWTSEIIATVGGELGLDLTSMPSTSGHLDILGPYEVQIGGQKTSVVVTLTGLASVSDLGGQQVLGEEVRNWIAEQQPSLIWLDGDPAQFQVGRMLSGGDVPIVFTGVVLDRRLYYSEEQLVCGVYRRHSLQRVLQEIWAQAPQATKYALLSDDSPVSLSRVQEYRLIEDSLPKGNSWDIRPQVHSWTELRETLRTLDKSDNAVIVCGMGEWNCSQALLDEACPADMLAGITLPVVALGPSRMDSCGVLSMRIKPAAHARIALEMARQILSGVDPRLFGVQTPASMTLFKAEVEQPEGTPKAPASPEEPAAAPEPHATAEQPAAPPSEAQPPAAAPGS